MCHEQLTWKIKKHDGVKKIQYWFTLEARSGILFPLYIKYQKEIKTQMK